MTSRFEGQDPISPETIGRWASTARGAREAMMKVYGDSYIPGPHEAVIILAARVTYLESERRAASKTRREPSALEMQVEMLESRAIAAEAALESMCNELASDDYYLTDASIRMLRELVERRSK